MANPVKGIAASLKAEAAVRLHDVAGNVALLGVVALLALTLWVTCIAGLIALLAPLWGLAAAIFIVALLVFITALILLSVLAQRTREQKLRAELRKAESRGNGRAALLAVLPGLLRHRSGALVIGLGLVIGMLFVASLGEEDEDEEA